MHAALYLAHRAARCAAPRFHHEQVITTTFQALTTQMEKERDIICIDF